MNIIEMKMYDEYLEKQKQENNYFKPKEPTHEDKQYWLNNNVDYNDLVEYVVKYALDYMSIILISTLYNHFHK